MLSRYVARTLSHLTIPYVILRFVLQQNVSASSVELLQDAIRFVGRFGSILNKSAIHVYFSALPFAPQGTTLYRVYSARYRDIPHVTQGYPESWPDELCTVRNLGGNDGTPRLPIRRHPRLRCCRITRRAGLPGSLCGFRHAQPLT